MSRVVFFILFLSLLYTIHAFEFEYFDSSTPAQLDISSSTPSSQLDTSSSTPAPFDYDSNFDSEEPTTFEAESLLRKRKKKPGSGSGRSTCEDGETTCDATSGQQCRCAESTCVPLEASGNGNMEDDENTERSPGSITLTQFKRAIETSKDTRGEMYKVSYIGRDIGDIYNNFKAFLSIGDIKTRTEAAMFFTNVIQETGGLRSLREEACKDGQTSDLCKSYDIPNAQCPDKPGNAHYYGRGYIQLSHCYNYRAAGNALQRDYYGQPDLVAQEVEAWRTAYWFWKDRVKGSRYGAQVKQFKFGFTIRAINCGFECKQGRDENGKKKADTRIANYRAVYKAFGASGPNSTEGCDGSGGC